MRQPFRLIRLLWPVGLALLLLGQACGPGPASDPESALVRSARQAFLNGQYLAAESDYERYLQDYRNGRFRLEAWHRLADIANEARESPESAADLLETAILEFSGDSGVSADLLSRAALLRAQLAQHERAASHLRALLSLPGISEEKRLDATLLLAQIRLKTGDGADAVAVLESCRHGAFADAGRAACALQLAQTLLRTGRAGEAEPLLHDLVANVKNPPALRARAGLELGDILEARKEKVAARALYKTVLDLHPNPLVVKKRLEYLE